MERQGIVEFWPVARNLAFTRMREYSGRLAGRLRVATTASDAKAAPPMVTGASIAAIDRAHAKGRELTVHTAWVMSWAAMKMPAR